MGFTFSEIRRRLLAVVEDLHSAHLQPSFSTIVSSPSLCVRGCMQSVSAGAEGIVWALAKDGVVYALSSAYNLFSGTHSTGVCRRQTFLEKWLNIRSMYSFVDSSHSKEHLAELQGGWKDQVQLPSREWSWLDAEWQVVDKEKYEDGWTYADSIDGQYRAFTKKKNQFRRRRWQRRCRFEGRGPWIAVETPPVRSIEVQKMKADRVENLYLFGRLPTDGQVLLRQGVTSEHPQGTTWKHIIGDFAISSISCASPTCVWATTVDGRLLRRECLDQTDMESVDWSEVVYSPLKSVFSFCASENYVFILPASDPQLILIDVKRLSSKICLSIPKAICITVDKQGNLYYCDGSSIVQLEKYYVNVNQQCEVDFRISERISDGSYAQCCFE
ncbi:Propeller [Cooperia oncophora]